MPHTVQISEDMPPEFGDRPPRAVERVSRTVSDIGYGTHAVYRLARYRVQFGCSSVLRGWMSFQFCTDSLRERTGSDNAGQTSSDA